MTEQPLPMTEHADPRHAERGASGCEVQGTEHEGLAAKEHEPGATAVSTYLSIIKNIIGSGILALPYSFASMGWLLGACLSCLSLALAAASTWLLVRSAELVRQEGGEARSYRELAMAAWGPNAARGVDVVIACYTCGPLIAYGKLIVQFLAPPLEHFGAPAAIYSRGFLLPVACCALVPLLAAKSIDGLKFTSLLGNVAIVYAVGVVFVGWLQLGFPVADSVVAVGQGVRVLQGLALTTGSWNFHYNMPVYYRELKDRSPRRMMGIIAAVYATTFSLYVMFMAGGYLRFGDATESNIINNLPTGSDVVVICRLCLGLMIIVTYPVVGFATKSAFARAFVGTEDLDPTRRWLLALLLVLAPISISVLVPNIGVVLSLDGAIFGVAQQLVIPAGLFLTLSRRAQEQSPGPAHGASHRWLGLAVLAAGLVIGPLGFTGTVITLVKGDSK